MKNSLASKQSADDEIEQNTMNREIELRALLPERLRIASASFIFWGKVRKFFDATVSFGVLQRKFSLDFTDEYGRLYLKGAPLFG